MLQIEKTRWKIRRTGNPRKLQGPENFKTVNLRSLLYGRQILVNEYML